MEDPELSLVIPAFNEQSRLPRTLERVRAYFDRELPNYEILVVDDGSADETARVARASLDGARGSVLSLPENRGKGAACRAGVLAARGLRILICDADLSTPISEERRLREVLDRGADAVIGSRGHPDAHVAVRQTGLRESAGRGLNLLLRALGLTRFYDTQCGFKMFTRDAGHALFEHCHVNGFLFDVEVLYLAGRWGLWVVELPVEWHNDPDSRVHMLRHLPSVLSELLQIRLRTGRGSGPRPS